MKKKTLNSRRNSSLLKSVSNLKYTIYIFHPDGKFKIYWNALILLFTIYSILVEPYQMAFEVDQLPSLFILELAIDSLFFIDMIISFFTGYYDEKLSVETSLKKIFFRYLKSWFILDLITCFPLQLIFQAGNYNSAMRMAGFKRLWKVARAAKLLRFVKILKNRDQRKNIHLAFKLSIQLERLLFFFLFIGFMIHIITCFWVFIGNLNLENGNNWIVVFGFHDYLNSELYIVAMYWCVTTLVTVGYGDIYATNSIERSYCFIIMITGILTYSYTVSSISNIISSLDSRNALLKKKQDTLTSISRKYKLSKVFCSRISRALEYEHRNHDKELAGILQDLPVGIKHELLLLIYEEKVCKNFFFKSKSLAFIAWVAPKLHPIQIQQNEFIYKENEFASEMYFIIKGKLSINLKREGVFYPLTYLVENYYFGEIDLLFSNSKNHLNSVKAEQNCDLLSLERDEFEEMLKYFEDEAIEICIKARKRLDRINQKTAEAIVNIDRRSSVRPRISYPEANYVDVGEMKKNARKSVELNSIVNYGSMYQEINEEKNPENFIKVIKAKIKRLNMYCDNITGLSNELLEYITARTKCVVQDTEN